MRSPMPGKTGVMGPAGGPGPSGAGSRGRAGRGRGRGAAFRAAAAVLALAAFLGPRPGAAQDPGDVRIGITYKPGYMPGLVLTRVKSSDDRLAAVAAEVEEIMGRDLEYADRFEIIPVPDSLRVGSSVNYGLWNQLGAVWLVTADVSGAAGSPLLRVGLHDVVYGQLKNVQAFTLPTPEDDGFRMAVHRISDAVVEWATGEPGIAATRIVFRRRSGDGGSDVYVVDSDGENVRRLTSGEGAVYSPSLSPDGTRLLYQVMHPDGSTAIYERDLRTGRRRTVSAEPGLNITPTYSPDGSRIAFARTVDDHTEIFETGRGRLTRTVGGDALNPTYSPDGRRFAFEATPLGQQQIYVQDVAGGQPFLVSRYVPRERGSASGPDWSPRGDRIAYSGWLDNVFQVFSVNPDGSERRVLTSRGMNEDPSWAPDGRHIVFSSTQRTGRSLIVLDAVSGRTRTLVSGRVDQLPDWSARISED